VARAVARKLKTKCITLDDQYRIYRIVPVLDGEGHRLTIDFAEMQGKRIDEDLGRRDFTVNAMAASFDFKRVFDPFQGQKDLRQGVLRAVSRRAFAEDPLRLLRAYRIAAQFNLRIETRTAQWLEAESDRLAAYQRPAVARERVREELLRLLNLEACAPMLNQMDRHGLLTTILP
jgi:tRNA nucleotidyltransferase/poly(A) polymerase